MKIIQGQGVSKGIEQGTIYFYHRSAAQVEMRTGADEQEERARLERAKERTRYGGEGQRRGRGRGGRAL